MGAPFAVGAVRGIQAWRRPLDTSLAA